MIKTAYYQDLTKMNTVGMKVKARCFIEYDSVADLVDIEFDELARPVLHIGGGSNLLFTDDFKGTILHSKINFIEILEKDGTRHCEEQSDAAISSPVLVSVGAGVVFDDFCDWAAKEGLWGVENLSYIPGEVGASAVQNIGAYGVEVKDVIKTVYCYDTVEEEFVNFDVEECEYGYRTSVFKTKLKGAYAVTHVVFRLSCEFRPLLTYGNVSACLPEGEDVTPQLLRRTIINIRESKLPDPTVQGNAGSFFMNPVVSQDKFEKIRAEYPNMPYYEQGNGVKIPAGWMIEQCGWKGKSLGRAGVHDRQALVLVNLGGATGEEVLELCDAVRKSVKEKFGVEIHPEVNVV